MSGKRAKQLRKAAKKMTDNKMVAISHNGRVYE
jgi:hypothetical protein